MAGPTVTLTFAGDEKQLTKAFGKVEQAAESMQAEVGSAAKSMAGDFDSSAKKMSSAADDSSRRIRDHGDGMERWADQADSVDTRAMGFRDTLTGVQDGLAGLRGEGESTFENLMLLGFGIGDLASGFANFLIPAMASFWGWLTSTTAATWLATAAQTAWAAITKGVTIATAALNAVMRANPILFVVGLIAALVIAFGTLWNKSEGFRNFFIGMWNTIKNVVSGAVNFIKNLWNGIPGFFRGIVSGIGRVFGGIGNAIKNAFKGAINFVIDLLNGAVTAVNGLIGGINLIPGVSIPRIPHIPKFHQGGIVPGAPGSETLAILQAGERVIPAGRADRAGGQAQMSVGFHGNTDSAVATLIMGLIRSGDIQIAGVA
ncbi:phage-related protein [Saccharomonospora amisosensis]|uniref:Phage-related protein n=1 Tax=Saccharomonospora amisosensis TaxID=1128677 RepID=A0A7X5ZPE3_9PSEU|nr:hypothetical protein [Saccharomonospora amisosensis]NIJ10629.1 phage-related protein [Saccharomonospora amisosensis]